MAFSYAFFRQKLGLEIVRLGHLNPHKIRRHGKMLLLAVFEREEVRLCFALANCSILFEGPFARPKWLLRL